MDNTTAGDDFTQFTVRMGNGSEDSTVTLEQLNDRRAILLIPVMIYLGILSVSGVVGNTLVFYIYKTKFNRSNHRNYILWLAFLDMFGSVFGIPFELIHMRYTFIFYEVELCTIGGFSINSNSCAGALVLIVIATDRYFKICRPFGPQMTPTTANWCCLVACISGVGLSWPNALFWGYTTVDTGVDNITGVDCFISDEYKNTKYPFIYDMVLIASFVMTGITLSFLYISIARRLRRGDSFRKQHMALNNAGRHKDSVDSPILPKSHSASVRENSDSSSDSQNQRKREYSDGCGSPRTTEKMIGVVTNGSGPKSKIFTFSKKSNSSNSGPDPTRKRSALSESLRFWKKPKPKIMDATRRITVLLFMVTLVFVLSFLPHLIIRVMTNIDSNMVGRLRSTDLVLYNIFFRSYFVNHMSNPILYGLMDRKFRNEVTALCKLLFCCKRTNE